MTLDCFTARRRGRCGGKAHGDGANLSSEPASGPSATVQPSICCQPTIGLLTVSLWVHAAIHLTILPLYEILKPHTRC